MQLILARLSLWISAGNSGTGGLIPLSKRSSNGTEILAKLFVRWGLIWRYSIFLLPAMICAADNSSLPKLDYRHGETLVPTESLKSRQFATELRIEYVNRFAEILHPCSG